jgi:hypothetical protein
MPGNLTHDPAQEGYALYSMGQDHKLNNRNGWQKYQSYRHYAFNLIERLSSLPEMQGMRHAAVVYYCKCLITMQIW